MGVGRRHREWPLMLPFVDPGTAPPRSHCGWQAVLQSLGPCCDSPTVGTVRLSEGSPSQDLIIPTQEP